jgi:hypothetical protein
MYVDKEGEWSTIQIVCKKLEEFDTHPNDTCVAIVSPDYSSIVGMHIAHHLSKDGEMLDVKFIEVPYPDENREVYYDNFLDPKNKQGVGMFHMYKRVILVEAGIITGKNYTFLKNVFTLHGKETITVAQYENVHSETQCDVVGAYYDSKVLELEFYWERFNKHWL